MTYEDLLKESDASGLMVKEKNLKYNSGRIKGRKVAIKAGMPTVKKACVLSEELGHYHKNTGSILDQTNAENRKQEHKARMWSFDHMIGLDGIIRAFRHGCQSCYEMAEYLEVTEAFLKEAIKAYADKYGPWIQYEEYMIGFVPSLTVVKKYK